ncbi:helix-turn-helix domain-containing protein [Microbacterium hominis]|uniref:Helix-turn-helix domain-containing protein n=2 Tax=Microbacterium hominis TaxID=162426 RepID=A0A7D4UJK2_9MICO|nr:helix-turn-helix domain-containing protein [Microbacterium hominis]
MRAGATVESAPAFDLAAFRAAVSDSFVPLRVSTAHPASFRGSIRGTTADSIHLTEVRATDHAVERTTDLIARDDRAFYKLSLMVAGSGMLVQDDHETVLAPGDLAVYDTSRPYALVFDDTMRTIVLMVPRHGIGVPPSQMRELTATRLGGADGAAAVVASFLAQLSAQAAQLAAPTRARLMRSALDLATTLFLDRLGPAAVDDPHTALLQRVHTHIDRHLGSPELTLSSIAAAHFISTRHLQGLFHDQGTTVSSWIRQRRLERCQRDLADPALRHVPLSAIGATWGFVEAAHFSRTFKAAYGVSPRAFRAAH